MDDHVDYSSYSVEQLREAHSGINRANYPINFARLRAECERRGIPMTESSTKVDAAKVSDTKRNAMPVKRLIGWIERTPYHRLVVGYMLAVPTCLALGWLAFYFPVYPIYAWQGWEFPNLGPIVTFLWGFVIAKYVLTPAFVLVLLYKLFLQSSSKA